MPRKPAPKADAPADKPAPRRRRRSTAKKPPEPPAPDLSHIVDDLRPLAVPLDQLQLDPANARTHDQKNLETIARSLARYGQRTPIVVNRAGSVILAGNGTTIAAQSLGWTHLAAVWVEDDAATAAGFSIADNRTAELAGWDDDILRGHLEALAQLEDFDLADTGFTDDDLQQLIADAPITVGKTTTTTVSKGETPPADPADNADATTDDDTFNVLVRVADADEQNALCAQLQEEGLRCRPFDV